MVWSRNGLNVLEKGYNHCSVYPTNISGAYGISTLLSVYTIEN